jgi:hypothetical protein
MTHHEERMFIFMLAWLIAGAVAAVALGDLVMPD